MRSAQKPAHDADRDHPPQLETQGNHFMFDARSRARDLFDKNSEKTWLKPILPLEVRTHDRKIVLGQAANQFLLKVITGVGDGRAIAFLIC